MASGGTCKLAFFLSLFFGDPSFFDAGSFFALATSFRLSIEAAFIFGLGLLFVLVFSVRLLDFGVAALQAHRLVDHILSQAHCQPFHCLGFWWRARVSSRRRSLTTEWGIALTVDATINVYIMPRSYISTKIYIIIEASFNTVLSKSHLRQSREWLFQACTDHICQPFHCLRFWWRARARCHRRNLAGTCIKRQLSSCLDSEKRSFPLQSWHSGSPLAFFFPARCAPLRLQWVYANFLAIPTHPKHLGSHPTDSLKEEQVEI